MKHSPHLGSFDLADFPLAYKSPMPSRKRLENYTGFWPGVDLNPDATLEPQDLESSIVTLQKNWEMLMNVHP